MVTKTLRNMSVNIPFEIQTEIIKRVPDVKSLIRFRAVSKPWKSFIDRSQFIAGYRARKTQPHSLLLRYTDDSDEVKYLSVNYDTFKVQQDFAPNVSALMKQLNHTLVIGSSGGLLCLYTSDRMGMLVLWNPSIRRSVGILTSVRDYLRVFGFAVCPVTNEPTIVKISFRWKVHIFTLSSKKWTEIQCRKPCESLFSLHSRQVVIGSCIYRVAYQTIRLPNGHFTDQYMIVSFDLIAKEFKAINLPNTITNHFTTPERSIISKLKGSLVVVIPHREVKVWVMDPDCSFTQQFTINTCDSFINNILGFRKNEELVFETREDSKQLGIYKCAVKLYEPPSRNIIKLANYGQRDSFFISPYKETLLLLDHLDSCVYPDSD